MSLLLDALKKAELAKQTGKTEPITESDVDTSQDIGEATSPVVTRQSLPNISPTLEILSPDFAPPQTPPADSGLKLAEDEPAVRPGTPREPAYSDPGEFSRPVGGDDPGRRAAKQMFEAKQMEYNPRRPFYITLGVLFACGAGYGVYLWWQLQPHYITTAAPAAASAAPAAATVPAAGPVSAAPGTAAAQPGTAVPGAAAPAQGAAAGEAPAAGPGAPPGASGSAAAGNPAPRAAAAAAAPRAIPPRSAATAGPVEAEADGNAARRAAPRRDGVNPIAVSPPTKTIDPLVEQGYDAFQRGDLTAARTSYERTLQRDSGNRDAMLGLAAIDMRNHDFSMAQTRYLRLLELNPRDPYALAGITALQGRVDPVQSESRLNTLIASQPQVPDLYFALGNELAAQARWPEAQASYFKAFALDSGNPDFAFNLAVSLDQLHQPKLALEYYSRALVLAGSRNAAFDAAQANTRIKELSR